MSPTVSVIIPTRNEEAWIARSVTSAFAAGASEVIVADGESSDGTVEVARSAGARVLACQPMRSRQLNAGAEAASGDALIFLHADTILPPGGAAAVMAALGGDADFGGFHLAFLEPERRLRVAAAMINLRTRITRCPWGDQAQFLRRDRFLSTGGYREMALMEDYELALRMKREGRVAILPQAVITSGRRFLQKGVLRTAAINWSVVLRYRLGTDPETLARWYRGS